MAKDVLTHPQIAVSVRQIVEFLLRSGDLTVGQKASVVDMAIGSGVHRRLQKEAKELDQDYQTEVRLSIQREFPDFDLLIRGNADGLTGDGDGFTRVDEIKTVSVPAELVSEPDRVLHWGQLKLYGHILCAQAGLSEIRLCLIYLEYETDILTRDSRVFSAQELEDYYLQLTDDYAKWMRWQLQHRQKHVDTAAVLPFPYKSFRRGQRTAAGEVYRAIRDGKDLFLTAPTGIGKTMATLYPAVKAHGEELGDKIFYLTAKTTTRAAVGGAIRLMEKKGLCHRTVILTAKEKICPYGLACGPESCPYCKGHFDRINGAVLQLLKESSLFSGEDLLAAGERFRVCPFELSLDLASWCDFVVGDYNHLFDPSAKLQRFFGGEQKNDHVILCDEAHNLVDRAREMYSADLSKEELAETAKPLRTGYPKLYRKIRRLVACFKEAELRLKSRMTEEPGRGPLELQAEFPKALVETAQGLAEQFQEALGDEKFQPFREQALPLYFRLSSFLTAAEQYDKRYTTCWTLGKKLHSLRLFCVDPSFLVEQSCQKCRSVILFSATFQPMDYYQRMLTLEEKPAVAVPSPFPTEHLLVLFQDGISTRYQHREQSLEPVARCILEAVSHKVGNYLAFFPSFAYLEQVEGLLREYAPELETVVQQRGMEEEERAAFLERFEHYGRRSLLGLAVVGGVFSEGIDLTGERLSGVMVVGMGLPQLCFERDLIREYFQRETGKGYDYAYRLPGLNRVFQAAGRVIRTEEDRGFVMILDDRCTHPDSLREYPGQWRQNLRVRSPEAIGRALEQFWKTEKL